MKVTLHEELHVLLLLSTLLDNWETLVVSSTNPISNGVLLLSIVKDSMLNDETRRKDAGIENAQD